MSGDKVKTLAGPALCIVGLVSLLFIALSFMTIASPGFLLYGFFSGEWLIEELAGTPLASTTGDNKIYYGLYRKCHHKQCSSYVVDGTTFGLEVTSVILQFLALLAMPWLKLCIPTHHLPEDWKEKTHWHLLKMWNYCFTPLLGLAAIFSLAASTYFLVEYNSKTPYMSTGTSQVCAGLGGGFQLVLVLIIAFFFCHRRRDTKSSEPKTSDQESIGGAILSHFRTAEGVFLFIFTYEVEKTRVDPDTQQHSTRRHQGISMDSTWDE